MKKLLALSVISIMTACVLYVEPVKAQSLLKDLADTIKSGVDIAKEAQNLKGQKKKDTSSSSWGSGSSWGSSGSSWGGSTGTSSWDWGAGTTSPSTAPSLQDPFAELGNSSNKKTGVEELKPIVSSPVITAPVPQVDLDAKREELRSLVGDRGKIELDASGKPSVANLSNQVSDEDRAKINDILKLWKK